MSSVSKSRAVISGCSLSNRTAAVLFLGFNVNPFATTEDDYFIFMCDTHIGRPNSQRNLEIAVDSINELEHKPEFVIIAGDLVDWGEGPSGSTNWKRFVSIMMELTVPYYVVPGNHDYRHIQQLTPPYSLSNYDYYMDNDGDYTIDHGNYHFIFMDSGSDYWEVTASPKGTGLKNSQMQWLKQDLESNTNKTSIIIMHHPAMDRSNKGVACIGNNREDFLSLWQL